MQKWLSVLVCSFFLTANVANSQAIKALEKDLVITFMAQHAYHDSVDEAHRHDSVMLKKMFGMAHIDSLCQNKMLYYTSKFPQTLKMDFKLLTTQDVNIVSSDDSLLRIYVWNERRMISNPEYKSVFQYAAANDVYSCLLPHTDTALTGASQAFFDAVYTLTANNKTYYLATYLNRYQPNLREEGIKVFDIENGKLNDTVHLIHTKTGVHNELSYKYDVIASGDAGSDNGIVYDTAEMTIQIPVVLDNGKMTGKHITYKFKDQYFEKVEVEGKKAGE